MNKMSQMDPVIYSPPPESDYSQFYAPFASERVSPGQMKKVTSAPGTSEVNHYLELMRYAPGGKSIMHPKPYHYLQPILRSWEMPCWDPLLEDWSNRLEEVGIDGEVEVDFGDKSDNEDEDGGGREVDVLKPVRPSRFTEHLDDDSSVADDEKSEEGYSGGDDWSGPPPATDFAGFLAPDQFASDSDADTDESENDEEDRKFWQRVYVDDVLDTAVRLVGKVQLKAWKAKREWVSVGNRLKKRRRKWAGVYV